MHSGRVWKPRAATIDITGKALNPSKGNHPGDLDGEYVLIGFLNDNLHEPVVLRALPHPSTDVGNENKDPGNRLRLTLADGDPDFWKHHGSFYGVDDDGAFLVDTRQANDGSVDASGNEPSPPTDGSGSQRYKLSQDAEHEITLWDMGDPDNPTAVLRVKSTKDDWTISFEEGASLKVEKKDSDAMLTLGDGAVHAAIYDALEMFWNQTIYPKFVAFDLHVHGSAVGPTGPPTPPLQLPTLDTTIKSTKVTFPDG